ncbi:ly6/PLAUR domain-containing protein 1-like [Scleropages formosus]|uniref:Ly6/PLAUR domain-containing protein 1-like n=1 Tax=Scleropages formosus TaxID=113540 RepID=A0A0N8K361_SCLFO|nr:ly6/PLAUR domain-containing protein 1-like [Scleropages formosus]
MWMQCYHCEESLLENDCSAPQFIVNCTANIQNACQKEVMVGTNGYQSFCSPGHVGSVCISCCNTPLCNGPRPPRISRAHALHLSCLPVLQLTVYMLYLSLQISVYLHCPAEV